MASRDHAHTHTAVESGQSHTPGPWRLTGDAGHPANVRITATARRHIAKVYAESEDRDLVAEANARLIAAAPTMREALESIARVDIGEAGRIATEVLRGIDHA